MRQSILKIALLLIITTLYFGLELPSNEAMGDSLSNKTREANQFYQQKKYDEALSKYADAQLDAPESKRLYFNIGDAHYRKGKYEEAINFYQKALATTDIVLEAKANYNIGNALYRQGKLRESLDYYKSAIDLLETKEIDIGDEGRKVREDAKYNYEFVQKKIKEMLNKQKQRQKNQQQKQKQQKKKENKQKQSSNQNNKKGKKKKEKKKQEQQKKKKTEEKSQPKAQPKKKKEMSKEEAEQLLQALLADEKNMRKRRRLKRGRYPEVEKDW